MPGLRRHLLLWTALVAFVGLSAPRASSREPGVSPQVPAVRFHHIHYRVGDPSAAMSEVARKLEGVRVIVPGLGVGVRAGAEYLLFDRLDDSDPADLAQLSITNGYAAALAWLTAHGVSPAPTDLRRLRVSAGLPEVRYHHVAFVADDLSSVVQALAAGGARPVRRTDDAVMFEAGGVLVEIVRDANRAETFWCPMHPDVRSADEGKCPLCGMSLVPIPPPKIGEYRLDVTQVREERGRGLTGLQLTVREPDTNATVSSFATVHEKLFHLFLVSRDLESFAHVHPQQVDGGFVLQHPLPPGEYMLIADFLPAGGVPQMVQKAIIVSGTRSAAAEAQPLDGLQIRLDAGALAAGKRAMFTFTVGDAKTGAPVTDLEAYLGAPAHMLIVRRDLTDAIHGHPEEASTGGPTISFHPLLPAAGDYKLWIQVQRAGQVITRSFDFTVTR